MKERIEMRRALVIIAIVVLVLTIFITPAYAQRDITRFGSNVVVREDEAVGNVTVFGGNVTIDGTVEENITVFGGNLRLNGRVGENVTHFGGNTILGENAVIEGDFTHFGGTVTRAPGAEIRGTETTGPRIFRPFVSFVSGLLSLIATLVLAAVVVALLPRQTAVLADTVEKQPLPSLGYGFLATILIPVVFILLFLLIIIGWILIPFVAIAIPIIYLYGYIGVSRWLGGRIIEATHIVQESPIAQVLIGALVLGIVGFIPILGWLVVLLAAIAGLGAVLISKFGTGQPWRRGRIPQAPPPETGRGAA
ncbi:MAG: hypothetical protein IBX64_03915 [Actinobacteria bacterium]|nr:hypothetical protein [Actinomycetota bacterium]